MAGRLRLGTWKPSVVFLTVALLAFGWFYGPSFIQWTSKLPATSEDAVKNYFTVAWHIEHSSNYSWFDGMNYPEGEQVTYTDNQPLVAGALKFLNGIFPVGEHLPWIFPLLLLASFIWGAWFLFMIINRQARSAQTWFNAALAIGIMLLTPQWQRLTGHYSLAHAWIIPCLLYLLHQYSIGAKGAFAIGLTLFLSGFIHPYFLVMGAMYCGFYLLLLMGTSKQLSDWKQWRTLLLTTFVPLLLFQVLVAMLDQVGDRPPSPYGFTTYIATARSLFFAPDPMLPDALSALVNRIGSQANEGSFYLGAMAIVVTVLSLIGLFMRGFKDRWTDHRLMLIAAIPILMLAMGLPFSIEGNEDLLRYAGPLRQFRGIGRFAFVGFFAINVYAAVWLRRRMYLKGQWIRVGWMMLAILWIEAFAYRGYIKNITSSGTEMFHEAQRPALSLDGYKAILPLPYYHTGSENFRTLHGGRIIASSMALSQVTGIPLLSVQLSRTSLSQTIDHLSLVTHTMEAPTISLRHPDEHWLLMVDPDVHLPAYQLQLIGRGTRLDEWNGFQLYRLRSDVYTDILLANIDASNYISVGAVELKGPQDSISSHSVYYDPCNDSAAFDKKLVRHASRSTWTNIIPDATVLTDTHRYELTFWMYAGDQGAMNTPVWYWEKDAGVDVNFHLSEVGDHVIGFKDDWALVRMYLKSSEPGHSFDIKLHRDGENIDLWIDEIILRPLGLNVYRDGPLPNINNRYYQPIDSLDVE